MGGNNLFDSLKLLRLFCNLFFFFRGSQEVKVFTDAGRAMRPLYVVQDNKLLIRKHHIRRLQDSNEK